MQTLPLKTPKIGIIGGEGTSPTSFGEVWHFFEKQLDFPATIIGTEYFANVDLAKYDVIVMPNGSYSKMLNEKTAKQIAEWVAAGGRLIAMESAIGALVDKPGFEIKHKENKESKKDTTASVKIYENREREAISEETPGSIYAVNMDNTHPLAFGYDKTYYSLVLKASDYAFLKKGWNVGTLNQNDLVTGFSGKKAQEKLKNSLIFGVEEVKKGQVVYMANNPLFRGFWQNGKLLFCNALFMSK